MTEYLNHVLHREITLHDRAKNEILPLIFRDRVTLKEACIEGQKFVIIEASDDMSLTELRKCFLRISRSINGHCALCSTKLNAYSAGKLIEENIPFVWPDHQVYLPFMGILLSSITERQAPPCNCLSFVTQKLLLKALYECWDGMTGSKAAQALAVSQMTVTRCFDEIEAMDIPVLQLKSRARKLFMGTDKRASWETIRPFLRNPVIETFRLAETVDVDLPLSGISALANYSLLEEDAWPTYALEKQRLKEFDIRKRKVVRAEDEEPTCVIHEVGYLLPFGDKKAVDPLSLTLILADEAKEDPRVEIAVKEMLEELVW